MNTYVTGAAIRQLREGRNLTQAQLAEKLQVSSKTVSKWETGKGLPDISLLQPLAQALRAHCKPECICQSAAQQVLCLSHLRQCGAQHRKRGGQLLRRYAASPGGGSGG